MDGEECLSILLTLIVKIMYVVKKYLYIDMHIEKPTPLYTTMIVDFESNPIFVFLPLYGCCSSTFQVD